MTSSSFELDPDYGWLLQHAWFVSFLADVERIEAAHPLTPEQQAAHEAARAKGGNWAKGRHRGKQMNAANRYAAANV